MPLQMPFHVWPNSCCMLTERVHADGSAVSSAVHVEGHAVSAVSGEPHGDTMIVVHGEPCGNPTFDCERFARSRTCFECCE